MVALVALAVVVILLVPVGLPTQSFAQVQGQPYAGGYVASGTNVYHTSGFGFTTYFKEKTGSTSGDVLLVISAAGASSSTAKSGGGWFYQLVNQWEQSTGVIYGGIDQVWGPDYAPLPTKLLVRWPSPFGLQPNTDLCNISGTSGIDRMLADAHWPTSSRVDFYHGCVMTNGMVDFVVTPYNKLSDDPNQYFLWGKCTGSGCYSGAPSGFEARFFQFGIETPDLTAPNNFEVTQTNIWALDLVTTEFSSPTVLYSAAYEARAIDAGSTIGWWTDSGGTKRGADVGGQHFDNVEIAADQRTQKMPVGEVKWIGGGCGTSDCIVDNFLLWNANSGAISTIGTTSSKNSPGITDSYEGERRAIASNDGKTVFAFYYDGVNNRIIQKTSNDGGKTWPTSSNLNTGTLVSDSFRWSVVSTTYGGTEYIYVFYWVQGSPDTQNAHFKFMRGTVSSNGQSVSWSSAVDLGYTLAHTDCGTGGACAAVVTSGDLSTGTLWAAFRYKPGGQSDYYFAIKYSTDGGFNWFDSWSHSDIGSTQPPVMALTSLGGGKMLWAYAFYNSNVLNYKVFTPGVGWISNSTTITGWTTTGDKQISAASDSTGNAYVALVTGGTSGSVKLAKFTNSGSFSAVETPPSGSLSHSLPSIVIASGDENKVIRVYTIANSKIYDTKKVGSTWQSPVQVFGPSSQTSPDQLTAGDRMASSLWRDGTNIKIPYNYY